MLGLMSSLADGWHEHRQVQFLLVCFLGLLLDAFVFSSTLIGLVPLRRQWTWQREGGRGPEQGAGAGVIQQTRASSQPWSPRCASAGERRAQMQQTQGGHCHCLWRRWTGCSSICWRRACWGRAAIVTTIFVPSRVNPAPGRDSPH